jgi:DivIVA domain-containing protein
MPRRGAGWRHPQNAEVRADQGNRPGCPRSRVPILDRDVGQPARLEKLIASWIHLVGKLAQLVHRSGTDADVPLGVRKLVDRIRSSRFGTTHRGGYDENEVDEFVDRIMDNLIRGERGTLQQLAGEAHSRR